MKKFSEAVLAKHKHMAKTASPHHPHSQALVYTPGGKEEIRPIDTADAGYGGEAVADAQGGEANPGKASKKAVSPMKMPTLVKTNEETERERLMKLRSFAHQQKLKGLGKAMMEDEQIDELKKSTLASYAKKATDDVSYHSFTAGTMSSKDPERLAQDKKAMKRQTGVIKAIDRLAKEDVEQVDEGSKRMSAAVKLQRAFDREKVSSDASRKRGEEMLAQARAEYAKKQAAKTNEEAEQVDEANTKMTDAHKKVAREVHRELKSGDQQVSQVHGDRIRHMHSQLRKKYGSNWRSLAGISEEAELDERNMENKAKKDNVVRQVGTHAYIKHGADAGSSYFSSKMTGRKVMSDPKFKSSKIADMYRKLPSMKEENNGTEADEGEYGYEGDMAMSQLKSIIRNAKGLHDLLEPQTDLPEWVQSKITLAADYIQTAADYWRSENEEGMNESMGNPAKDAERLLGGPVKKKSSVIGGKGQPTNLRNLTSRLATKAMKAGKSVSEKKMSKVPRVGEMEMTLEEYIDI